MPSISCRARYDVDAIFNAVGDARNSVILTLCVDITLYRLHYLINPRKIPSFRKEAWMDAKTWLEQVKAEEINQPGLPVVANDTTRDYMKFGGNLPRSNYI